MLQEKGAYKRFVKARPGGINCACCFPQKSAHKKKALRMSQKAFKVYIQSMIADELLLASSNDNI